MVVREAGRWISGSQKSFPGQSQQVQKSQCLGTVSEESSEGVRVGQEVRGSRSQIVWGHLARVQTSLFLRRVQ